MARSNEPIEPMDLANMRANGVRSLMSSATTIDLECVSFCTDFRDGDPVQVGRIRRR